MAFSWRVRIDFDGDGDFSEPYEDISPEWQRLEWSTGTRRAFNLVADEAEARITVLNTTGKYNPENTSSPIYGELLPGRLVEIAAVNGAAVDVMYTGWIESIDAPWKEGSGAAAGKQTAMITCTGSKQLLQKTDVVIGLYTDTTGDQIVGDILDALSLTKSVETGRTVIPFYGDGSSTKKAYGLIQEITEAERGRFFHNRAGVAVWWNRDHLLGTSAAVATVGTGAGHYKPRELDYGHGRYLSNSIRVTANQRTVETTDQQLWKLESAVTVAPASVLEFEIELRKESGQFAAASGLTIDSYSFSSGAATIAVTPKGGKAIITLTNSGSTEAILSALVLKGQPITTQNRMTATAEDAASIAAYGIRGQRDLNLRAVASFDFARQVAIYEIGKRGTPCGDVASVRLVNAADGSANVHQIAWQIGTRIAVDISAQNGHSADYFVIGEEHTAESGKHETTFFLEPADMLVFWVLGVSGKSELGVSTYLGL